MRGSNLERVAEARVNRLVLDALDGCIGKISAHDGGQGTETKQEAELRRDGLEVGAEVG